jgi:hypothetical protein
MAVIQGGTSGNQAEVDSAFSALRVTERPLDVGTGGAYRTSVTSGLMTGATMAAAAPLFSFRWGSTTLTALITRFEMKVVLPTSVTSAQEIGLDAFVARSFTASDSAGTSSTTTGNNMKKRTSHATSGVTNIQIGGATALTAGTRTLDASPFMSLRFWELATGAAVPHIRASSLFDASNPGTYPLVFAQDEGIVVQNSIAFTASGTMRLTCEVEWYELTNGTYGA